MAVDNKDPKQLDLDPNKTPQDDKVVISPEDFKKVQSEKAELESSFNALKAEIDSMKNEKLKLEGNKDELIKSLETKLSENTSKLETETNKFKLSKVISQFRETAVKEGVKHVDDLQKLYSDHLKTVKVNANFEVEGDSLKQIISMAKEKSPYLFASPAPKIDDINHTKAKMKQDTSIKENLRKQLL